VTRGTQGGPQRETEGSLAVRLIHSNIMLELPIDAVVQSCRSLMRERDWESVACARWRGGLDGRKQRIAGHARQRVYDVVPYAATLGSVAVERVSPQQLQVQRVEGRASLVSFAWSLLEVATTTTARLGRRDREERAEIGYCRIVYRTVQIVDPLWYSMLHRFRRAVLCSPQDITYNRQAGQGFTGLSGQADCRIGHTWLGTRHPSQPLQAHPLYIYYALYTSHDRLHRSHMNRSVGE